MVVQGTLLADGDENEKVRFIRKKHQGEFRLSGGSGPWGGDWNFWSMIPGCRCVCRMEDLSPWKEKSYVNSLIFSIKGNKYE